MKNPASAYHYPGDRSLTGVTPLAYPGNMGAEGASAASMRTHSGRVSRPTQRLISQHNSDMSMTSEGSSAPPPTRPKLMVSTASYDSIDSRESGSAKRKKEPSAPTLHSPRTRANSNNNEPRKRMPGAPDSASVSSGAMGSPSSIPSPAPSSVSSQAASRAPPKDSTMNRKMIKSERERERRAAVRNLFLAISVELNLREEGDNSALDQTQVLAAAISKLKEPDNLASAPQGHAPLHQGISNIEPIPAAGKLMTPPSRVQVRQEMPRRGSEKTEMMGSPITPQSTTIEESKNYPAGQSHLQQQLQASGSGKNKPAALGKPTKDPVHAGMISPVVMPMQTAYDGSFGNEMGKYAVPPQMSHQHSQQQQQQEQHLLHEGSSVRRHSLFSQRDSLSQYPIFSTDSRRGSTYSTGEFLTMQNLDFDAMAFEDEANLTLPFPDKSDSAFMRRDAVESYDFVSPSSLDHSLPTKHRPRANSRISQGAAYAQMMGPSLYGSATAGGDWGRAAHGGGVYPHYSD